MNQQEFKILTITTAYEQGVGHAKRPDIRNPYQPGSDEYIAWDNGRQEGLDKTLLCGITAYEKDETMPPMALQMNMAKFFDALTEGLENGDVKLGEKPSLSGKMLDLIRFWTQIEWNSSSSCMSYLSSSEIKKVAAASRLPESIINTEAFMNTALGLLHFGRTKAGGPPVVDSTCNYLCYKGQVCNKCGKIHDNKEKPND